MTEDEIFWDTHEELGVKLEREPSYEEVIEHLAQKFRCTEEEKVDYYQKRIYGK